MTAVVRHTQGHLARTFVLASSLTLPFALMACGGDEPASVPAAEARPVNTSVVPPEKTPEVRASGGTVVAPVAFGGAEDAYKAGNYRVATEMYRSKVTKETENAHDFYMLGLASWKSGDFTGAKIALEKSIALDSTVAKAHFNLARVLLDLQRAPEAMEEIEKGRAIDVGSLEGLRLRARAEAEQGNVDAALETYRTLLVENEADAWGLNNLGMLMFQRGDVTGALGPLARAVQVTPTAPLFLNNLGMALEKSGYTVAALRRYELAVQHDSSYVKAVRNLERLKGTVTDTAVGDEVDVREMAEQFRLTVRSWKPPVLPTPSVLPVPPA